MRYLLVASLSLSLTVFAGGPRGGGVGGLRGSTGVRGSTGFHGSGFVNHSSPGVRWGNSWGGFHTHGYGWGRTWGYPYAVVPYSPYVYGMPYYDNTPPPPPQEEALPPVPPPPPQQEAPPPRSEDLAPAPPELEHGQAAPQVDPRHAPNSMGRAEDVVADRTPGNDIYHWVDDDGVDNYSTFVPPAYRSKATKVGAQLSGVVWTNPPKSTH